MTVPDIIGVEVLTPDGRGSILSLHKRRVTVYLNTKAIGQVMTGLRESELHYSYPYEDVEIIKGQYCFKDSRLRFQYPEFFGVEPKIKSTD